MNTKFKDYNLSILSDLYEYTMAQGYFNENIENKITYFDIFYRKNPDDSGYAIFSGLEHIVELLGNMKFNDEDIEYFKSLNVFDNKFLSFLKNFKFDCDIWSVPEGSVIFPKEPIMIVKGPSVQAQIIETLCLLILNHESLIATKSNRIKRAAKGRSVMEFGARRAQGIDAAVYGAKAAYIAGVDGTSNVLTGKMFNIPVMGTMAHAWVQMFETELDAFKAFAKSFPNNCVLLVDTYNTLQSGVPNAIKTFDEILKPMGIRPKGIRLDSGDLAYLSKQARKMLNDAGYQDVQIVVSNSLDEYTIRDLLHQGAMIDSFGIGERLITSKTSPVFGGVYKLVAIEENGKIIPKIKVSENVDKITTPGFKNLYRIYNKKTNKAEADLITLFDEEIDETKPLEIFHPIYTWKRTVFDEYTIRPMLHKIFENGNLIYKLPDIEDIRNYCQEEVDSLWDEFKRFDNPHIYKVDLSEKLWKLKTDLLNDTVKQNRKKQKAD
ncbi:MAG: nicotinate phosphoribosyltransferase [Peptoniphilaceae bacterium]|uniref:nicotinate phosphoribosyltransferase n=1 Tax=Parvimonas sp. TaxID=1944660 RepID=UPI0025EB91D1|nr:nicotinate phosphoribosyltransferase [Parvimonas sp.]MCI5998013.1 nicotinate phosphoribosyltransferase [Parvimonas sp.]MDD7764401.1 nicotinate phosphoribosyltransferase [Peptoniphilaceae bacterium]MDY3051389.1 nicotinate phosphoribosyltransferase [Parvimonas sp.]